MPGPLLAVDAPSLLYRAFYALPKTITDAKGTPVNALLGIANLVLQAVERHDPRAVVLCFGEEAAHYRVELYPTYHADRIDMPEELVPQWGDAPAFFGAFNWTVAAPRDARGRRPARRARAGRGRRRRAGAALHRRPRHVPVRLRRRHRPVAGGQGRDRADRARGGPRALRHRAPTRCPTSSPCAATRPTGCRAPRASARRPPRELLQRARHARRAARRCPSSLRPRVRQSLTDQADELRAFREIATLQPAGVERPPDAPTDFAGAAAAARERSMNRLAERLDAWARA